MGNFDTVILYTLRTDTGKSKGAPFQFVLKVYNITVSKSPMSRHLSFSDNSIWSGAEQMQLVFFDMNELICTH